MSTTPGIKQSIYLPDAQLREIEAQAERLDRSLSWVAMLAWRIAKAQIRIYPPAPTPKEPRARRASSRLNAGKARAKRQAIPAPPPERTPRPLAERLDQLAAQRRERRRPPPPVLPPPPDEEPAEHRGTAVSRAWEAHLLDHRGQP